MKQDLPDLSRFSISLSPYKSRSAHLRVLTLVIIALLSLFLASCRGPSQRKATVVCSEDVNQREDYQDIDGTRAMFWSVVGEESQLIQVRKTANAYKQLTSSREWLREAHPEYSRPSLTSEEDSSLDVVLSAVLGETTLFVTYGNPAEDAEVTATFDYDTELRAQPVCVILDFVCNEFGYTWRVGPDCVRVAKTRDLLSEEMITLVYSMHETVNGVRVPVRGEGFDVAGLTWSITALLSTTSFGEASVTVRDSSSVEVRADSAYHVALQLNLDGILGGYRPK